MASYRDVAASQARKSRYETIDSRPTTYKGGWIYIPSKMRGSGSVKLGKLGEFKLNGDLATFAPLLKICRIVWEDVLGLVMEDMLRRSRP